MHCLKSSLVDLAGESRPKKFPARPCFMDSLVFPHFMAVWENFDQIDAHPICVSLQHSDLSNTTLTSKWRTSSPAVMETKIALQSELTISAWNFRWLNIERPRRCDDGYLSAKLFPKQNFQFNTKIHLIEIFQIIYLVQLFSALL